MIKLSDISELMQKVVAKGITFMIGGVNPWGGHSLHFAKYTTSNKTATLDYHDNLIRQCADLEHPIIEFDNVDDVYNYVLKELGVEDDEN